ncbi:Metallo-dependent hydrolase [Imleria badia]|nr:Metallo-dependent hydrolase [Imleria badia]
MDGERTLITNVHLAYEDVSLAKQLWDVQCVNGRVLDIIPSGNQVRPPMVATGRSTTIQGNGGTLLPSLCHAHIHLDKCFIMDQCDPLLTGSLPEALQVTNKIKARFPDRLVDLHARATRLVRQSVEAGVTAMRAYVEIDTTVGMVCLDTGLKVKSEWEGVCDIQIVAFAQEALYPSATAETAGDNFKLLQTALACDGISVVGSAPWVEPSRGHAHKNIAHILKLAEEYNLHADFHLDYNLDVNAEAMVWETLRQMRKVGWTKTSAGNRRVAIGHATRLGMFTPEEWSRLRGELDEFPLGIVSLPQSDIYMMGRPNSDGTRSVPLAERTLDVARIWRDHGIHVALSVNNVENAFTPQGYLDPLTLTCLEVGLFQVGTERGWRELLRSVSTTSKEVIGVMKDAGRPEGCAADSLVPFIGAPADFVLIHEARGWQSAILSPSFDRTTVFGGREVARRKAFSWTALDGMEGMQGSGE